MSDTKDDRKIVPFSDMDDFMSKVEKIEKHYRDMDVLLNKGSITIKEYMEYRLENDPARVIMVSKTIHSTYLFLLLSKAIEYFPTIKEYDDGLDFLREFRKNKNKRELGLLILGYIVGAISIYLIV